MRKAHQLNKKVQVKLIDNQRCPVDDKTLPLLILQYEHDSQFFLEIEVDTPDACPISKEVILFNFLA